MASSQSTNQAQATGIAAVAPDRSRWVAWLAIGLLFVMVISMALVSRLVDNATREIGGRAMRMILFGNVAEFRLYVEQLQKASEQLASHPFTLAAVGTEVPSLPVPIDENLVSSRMKRMRGSLPSIVEAWIITDALGKVLASDDKKWIGRDCVWSTSNLGELQTRSSTIVLPGKVAKREDAILLSLSPIFHEHELQGTVGWVIDPYGDLSDRLANTTTESAFLFDGQARMLTRSRLWRGAANATAQEKTTVREWQPIPLRVPHESSAGSLTVMAEQAIRGSSGLNTEGYLDHRGISVIAAWHWMPDYRLGMAFEIDASEGLYSADLVKLLLAGLLATLVLSGLLVLGFAVRSNRHLDPTGDEDNDVRRLGQYELVELLGVGGMGSVYRGRHEFLRRDVAIKVLEGDQLSKQAVTRFRREVQSTSKLRHPNTIAIYDYGQAESLSPADIRKSGVVASKSKRSGHANFASKSSDELDSEISDRSGVFYYVMEYIDGISLQQLIDYYGPQSPERTVHLLLQICGSIAEAHQAGLIHRDIKPGNILLCAESNSYDHVKVLDFGLVKDINAADTVAVTMTRSDSITGTPLYMAPETIRDATHASPSGDLYSIGAVGYALLTGKRTYEGESAIDLCLKQLEEAPLSPDIRLGRFLPQGLQDCIMSCLSLDPGERPSSISQLVEQLDELPESAGWNQVDSAAWWETVFEANRQKGPVETKSDTVADQPLEGAS